MTECPYYSKATGNLKGVISNIVDEMLPKKSSPYLLPLKSAHPQMYYPCDITDVTQSKYVLVKMDYRIEFVDLKQISIEQKASENIPKIRIYFNMNS